MSCSLFTLLIYFFSIFYPFLIPNIHSICLYRIAIPCHFHPVVISNNAICAGCPAMVWTNDIHSISSLASLPISSCCYLEQQSFLTPDIHHIPAQASLPFSSCGHLEQRDLCKMLRHGLDNIRENNNHGFTLLIYFLPIFSFHRTSALYLLVSPYHFSITGAFHNRCVQHLLSERLRLSA